MAFLDNKGVERLWLYIISLVGGKVDRVEGKGLSTNDYTNEDKEKLSSISDGATKITVDDALSDSSTNPVQNKIVNNEIANLTTLITELQNRITALENTLNSNEYLVVK